MKRASSESEGWKLPLRARSDASPGEVLVICRSAEPSKKKI
jgi:hypothetical protein